MDTIQDFEDMLHFLDKHDVRHQEDVRVLREVKKRRKRSVRTKKS